MTFTHIGLRTTDVDAAAEFYAAVFGRPAQGIFPLPPQAKARGAPAHWLGFITVPADSFSSSVEAFLARGAQRLGPPSDPGGTAILRDPGGAVVALTRGVPWQGESAAWHQLHAANAARVAADYAELAGVHLTGPQVSDIEGRPELHPHWLFYFAVGSLDGALATVTARGGRVVFPATDAGGMRIAVCEDPQGAEFGLLER
jgi:predicted enzyme related to lactoylglutathione lyase